jgi:hypothetical protein
MEVTIASPQDWACCANAYWKSDENSAKVYVSRVILGRGGLAPDGLDESRGDSLSIGPRQGPYLEWMAIAHSRSFQSVTPGNP